MSATKEHNHDTIEKGMRIFLVPLHDLKTFLKYLEGQSHDIDIMDNATLELEWENYCRIKVQQGEE